MPCKPLRRRTLNASALLVVRLLAPSELPTMGPILVQVVGTLPGQESQVDVIQITFSVGFVRAENCGLFLPSKESRQDTA